MATVCFVGYYVLLFRREYMFLVVVFGFADLIDCRVPFVIGKIERRG
jgi:hypothetical protein